MPVNPQNQGQKCYCIFEMEHPFLADVQYAIPDRYKNPFPTLILERFGKKFEYYKRSSDIDHPIFYMHYREVNTANPANTASHHVASPAPVGARASLQKPCPQPLFRPGTLDSLVKYFLDVRQRIDRRTNLDEIFKNLTCVSMEAFSGVFDDVDTQIFTPCPECTKELLGALTAPKLPFKEARKCIVDFFINNSFMLNSFHTNEAVKSVTIPLLPQPLLLGYFHFLNMHKNHEHSNASWNEFLSQNKELSRIFEPINAYFGIQFDFETAEVSLIESKNMGQHIRAIGMGQWVAWELI